SPLFTVIVAWVALAETLTAAAVGAIVLTLLGLMLVTTSPSAFMRLAAGRPAGAAAAARRAGGWRALLRSGLMVGMASSAAYAIGNVLRGAGSRRWDEPILGALLGAITAIALQVVLTRGNEQTLRQLRDANLVGIV